MSNMYQLSIDDLEYQTLINAQPGRIAYIDESGSFGFDFSKAGTLQHYVLCAIVVEDTAVARLHDAFLEVKKTNGLANTEVKSSAIAEPRRMRMMTQLMPLEFRIVVLIADKRAFYDDSPLVNYKTVFIKYLGQHLYNLLYQAYPKLRILQDETGRSEFKESFIRYVEDHRPQRNLLNEYDFDFVNSKDETLVQLADFIAGSIRQSLLSDASHNYLEMLKGKIAASEFFPNVHEPYWGRRKPEDQKYNAMVYSLAVKCAVDYIMKYQSDMREEKRCQVAVLRYLLFIVSQVDSLRYVYSDELRVYLRENLGISIKREYLFRRIIAPLRDEGVILASCSKGYKIPISVEDIMTYMNQTTSTVGPMIQRMGICRNLIKQNTENNLDMFSDPAFIRFKRYFDEL